MSGVRPALTSNVTRRPPRVGSERLSVVVDRCRARSVPRRGTAAGCGGTRAPAGRTDRRRRPSRRRGRAATPEPAEVIHRDERPGAPDPSCRLTIEAWQAPRSGKTRALRPSSRLLAPASRHATQAPSGPASPSNGPSPPGQRGADAPPDLLPVTSRNRGKATVPPSTTTQPSRCLWTVVNPSSRPDTEL